MFISLRKPRYFHSFTLLELLIVIAILAILASVTFIALNPAEQLKKARDSRRLADLKSLHNALSIYESQSTNAYFGTSTWVYLSLPDANANCSSYSLPTIPSGYSYACVTEQSLRKTDGSGWVPTNLSSIAIGSPVSALPVDPQNTASYYYAYIPGGSWELTTKMEAQQNILAGSKDMVSSDGGDEPTRFEIGSNIFLSPWNLEFSALPTATNNSNKPGWYKYTGTGSLSTSGSGAEAYATASGYVWYVWQENIPFNENATYKITCKFRQVSDPTSGGKFSYCGWAGVASDGTTLVNKDGNNSYGSNHYHAAGSASLTAGAGYSTFTGYTYGWGSPTGTGYACPNVNSPCKMHQNVRYLRPLFILNYDVGNGVADIDFIIITKQ